MRIMEIKGEVVAARQVGDETVVEFRVDKREKEQYAQTISLYQLSSSTPAIKIGARHVVVLIEDIPVYEEFDFDENQTLDDLPF